MKVLVAGATGFIGKILVEKLIERDYEVVVLTRNPKAISFNIPVHPEIHSWDPDLYFLSPSVMRGIKAVINLSGKNIANGWWTKTRKQMILDSRTKSVKCLIKAFQLMDQKPDIFLSASAIGYYGDFESEIIDEETRVGSDFLSEICESWENEIFKAEILGIRTVAYRIGMVLGHDGGVLKRILPLFKVGLGGHLGHGRQWMSWIHISDLIEMMIHAIENPGVKGVVNAVSPHPVMNRDFSKILGKVLKMPTVIPIPKFVLKIALGELSSLLLNSQRVIANKISKTGFSFTYPTLEDALREICSPLS